MPKFSRHVPKKESNDKIFEKPVPVVLYFSKMKYKRVQGVGMKKKKILPLLLTVGFITLVIFIIILSSVIEKYIPSKEKADLIQYYELQGTDDVAIVLDQQKEEEKGKYIDGQVYLAYDMVHSKLNQRFYWDANEEKLLYTTAQKVLTMEADQKEYLEGKEKKVAEKMPACEIEGKVYINLDLVKEYSDISYEFYQDPNRIVLTSEWNEQKQALVKKDTQLRVRGGIKSPILKELKKEDMVQIIESGDKWDKVMTPDGLIGYMKKKFMGDEIAVAPKHTFEEEKFEKIQKDFKINLAWHQVHNANDNLKLEQLLATTKGINVVSPTWFYLNDNEGNIGSYASQKYVNDCHERGIEVWALVSNLVNTQVDTTKVLTHTSIRNNFVNQIIGAAIQYNLDGINVDLESISQEVGDGYIQFIRELSLKCEDNGIVLSVDNYVPSAYTAFYNRAEQAVFADYVVIMAYDEHYAGSDEGSVSSIGFVKKGVEDTLAQVPADQTILGMPFFTRMWCETPKSGDGDDVESASEDYVPYDLTSEALGMSEAESRLKVNGVQPEWSEETGQYYGEYANGESTYKVWLETSESLEEKLKVMKDHELAGAAYWKLGLEKSNVWDMIRKYMKE